MAKHADDPGTLDLFPDELARRVHPRRRRAKNLPHRAPGALPARPAGARSLQVHGLGHPAGSGAAGTAFIRPALIRLAGFPAALAVAAVPGGYLTTTRTV